MTGTVVPFSPAQAGEVAEQVLIRGDLAALTNAERARYYVRICESLGLNPMTKPFEYIELNRKLTLYATKACTDQLRKLHGVSVVELAETERDGVYIVTAKMVDSEGRTDAAKGAVSIQGLRGDALANALMKAETKAKRRATLSLCGLGFLDETEIETIPEHAKRTPPAVTQTEVKAIEAPKPKPEVRTVVPAPKHSLKPGGIADRARTAMKSEKIDEFPDWYQNENPAHGLQPAE